MKSFVHFIATGFYSGHGPFMPGTWGTVVGVLVWSSILPFVSLSEAFYICFLMFLLGWTTSNEELKKRPDDPDPPYIVIDEIVGVGIPLIVAVKTFESLPVAFAASFFAFRYFDILKIWPIGNIELFFANRSRILQSFGIMIDDGIAGFMALGLLLILRALGLLS